LDSIGLDTALPIKIERKISVVKQNIPNTEKSILQALHYNTDYQIALLGRAQIQRGLVSAKDDKLWQLDWATTVTTGGGSGRGPNSDFDALINRANYSANTSLTLTVPIGDVDLEKAVVEAEIAVRKNNIDLSQKKRTLIKNMLNALESLNAQEKTIEFAEQAATAQKKVVDITIKKKQYGLATEFEEISQRDTYVSDQQAVTTAQIAYLNRLTDLRQQMGTTLEYWGIRLNY